MTALVTKAEFAAFADVSKAAVTQACRPGKSLAAACVGSGRNIRIDMAHPVAVSYLSNQAPGSTLVTQSSSPAASKPPRVRPGTPAESPRQRPKKLTPPPRSAAPTIPPPAPAPAPSTRDPDDQVPENIRAFLDWTLAKLIRQFGTDTAFLDWLKATKVMEEIQAKQLDNARSRGELVERQLVKVAFIDPVDEAHRRLLGDGTKNIANRVTTMAKAGRTTEEIEAAVADIMSSFLRPMKDRITRSLKQMQQNGK